MHSPAQPVRWEWAFILCLFALCALLTVLQYRWTGEVSRAESARMRIALAEQAQALAREFDAELTERCRELLPSREEFEQKGREIVLREHLRAYAGAPRRPLFRRMACFVMSNCRLLDGRTSCSAPTA